MNNDIKKIMDHNLQVLFDNNGPRLSSAYRRFVAAKDAARGLVLMGGLGAMGVGQMWVPMDTHKGLPGLAEAPERDSTDGRLIQENIDRELAALDALRSRNCP